MSSSIKRPTRAPASLSQDGMNRAIALRTYTVSAPQLTPATAQASPPEMAALDDVLASQNPAYALQALTLRAEMLSTQEKWEEALASYDDIIQRVQNSTLSASEQQRMLGLAQLNRAWLLVRNERLKPAATACQQALDLLLPLAPSDPAGLAPSLMMLYRLRAQIQRRHGHFSEALADLEQSTQLQQQLQHSQSVDPADLVHDGLHLAELRQALLEPQQALQALQSIASALDQIADPALAQDLRNSFYMRRAQLFEALDQPQLAYTDYRSALQLQNPVSAPQNWLRLFLLAAALGLQAHGIQASPAEWAQARTVLKDLESQATMDAQLGLPLLILADLLHTSQPDDALELYANAIRCLERSGASKADQPAETLAQAYLGRAQLLQDLGQAPKALTSYRQARRLLQNHNSSQVLAELDLKLALCCQQAGKAQQALEAFAQAEATAGPAPEQVSSDSVWVQIPYFRAFLYVLDLQQPEQALQDLERVNARCPGFASYDLACLYTRSAQPKAALAALRDHLNSPYALAASEILADSDLAPLHGHPDWPLPQETASP